MSDSSQVMSSTLVADTVVKGGTPWAFADGKCAVGYDADKDSDNVDGDCDSGDNSDNGDGDCDNDDNSDNGDGDCDNGDSCDNGDGDCDSGDNSDNVVKQNLCYKCDKSSDNVGKQKGIGGSDNVNMVTTDSAASNHCTSDSNRIVPPTHDNDIHIPTSESHDYCRDPMLLSESTTQEARPSLLPSNHSHIWQVSDKPVLYEGHLPTGVFLYKEEVLVKLGVTQLEGVAEQLGRKLTSKLHSSCVK